MNECDPVYKTHFLLFGLSDFGVIFYCFISLDLILHCHYLLEAYFFKLIYFCGFSIMPPDPNLLSATSYLPLPFKVPGKAE